MKKAFFINGGAGRVLCAIPALEYHVKHIDPTVIIIVEGWTELCLLNKAIMHNVYTSDNPNLFSIIKDREVISPEPYRLNAYFNQKCNLIQAFDMLINYDMPPEEIPPTKECNIFISKADNLASQNLIIEAKTHLKKEKVIVFQPFGSAAKLEGNFVIDESGRSFEIDDILKIVEELSKDYVVIIMSSIKLPISKPIGIVVPEQISLVPWAAIINAADYFLGCDSVGQHMANAVDTPCTVVIGSTFAENTSYQANPKFNIIDNGKGQKIYSPIRLTYDIRIEKTNEYLMKLDDKTINSIIKDINETLNNNSKSK
jgi:hypothetical protein